MPILFHSDSSSPGRIRKAINFAVRLLSNSSVVAMVSLAVALPAAAAPFTYIGLTSNKVGVVDVSTNTLVKEISVGSGVSGIAADPSGRLVYVANRSSGDVSVIDTQSNLVTRSISPTTLIGAPTSVAVSPNGTRVYVTSYLGGGMSVVDAGTGLSIAQIPLISPGFVAVSPSGNLAYVAQDQANITPTNPRTVAVVDLVQNRVVAQVVASVMSQGLSAFASSNILFSPDGSRAYISEVAGVAVVNTATHTVIERWTTLNPDNSNGFVSNLALSADGSRLYAVTYNDKKLVTFDTATGAVLSRFTYGNEPTSLVVNSAQQVAILFGNQTGLATSVNLSTGAVIKEVPTGGAPRAYGAVVANVAPAQQIDSGGVSGGGGGCGYLSGNGGPPDPTLPFLAMLALLMLASRGRFMRR